MHSILTALALVLSITPQAFAQDTAITTKIDTTRLQLFYEQQIADPTDDYTRQLIADERASIRDLVEEELTKTIAPVLEEEYVDATELTKAVDRQRNVISALQERLSDRKVDLGLLITEEQRFYTGTGTGSGATNHKFRLTKSYPELLAKKAVFEERIAVLNSLIALQETRLKELLHDQRLQQFSLLISVGTYLAIIILILLIERGFRKVVLSRIKNLDHRYTATKMFTSSVYILIFAWILGVLLNKQPGILASLAIVGAGIAIALQDAVKDILGWFIIVQHRLFSRGHRISVGDMTGEVVDLGLFRTTLLEIGTSKPTKDPLAVLERTGKMLSIPNHTYLTESVTNHTTTSDFVRAELRITVTFESNWRKAQEICKQIIDDLTLEYVERDQKQSRYRMQMLYIPHRTAGNQVYVDIAADGVELTLRFTVPIGERRPISSSIADMLLERINKEDDIHLAYTTQRILAEMISK
ncbi:MAG: mechanosensitive ion channel [Candidatus Peregrinibacteria bacterium]|nr:mechanosensitive ion channel [Candidatus Peregrinibacteria bacterium]MCB9807653.1 mechanosensitive ion channel [Candidatus Peribacteria bacterium]